MLFDKEMAKNLPSLSVLVFNSICKAYTFMMKNCEGQPHVTAAKRILESVIPKLVEFFKEKEL